MNKKNPTHGRGILDTLGQTRTSNSKELTVTVTGKGTDLNDKKLLENKAKKKAITQEMTLGIIAHRENEGAPKTEIQQLWNTYHCQGELIIVDGRSYGNYCKTRGCTVCLGIRKADMMRNYLPIVRNWKDAHFVTLTRKSVPARYLNKAMDSMYQKFKGITDKHRKRASRGTGFKLVGFKSLECNFNPFKETYNPHFHFVVETKEMAEMLRAEWLWRHSSKSAVWEAQDVQKVRGAESVLIEVIKYGTKVFMPYDPNGKEDVNQPVEFYAEAWDVIINAMDGRRVFDRFGFNKCDVDDAVYNEPITTEQYKRWVYEPLEGDWVEREID
jgi:hypothetical protein